LYNNAGIDFFSPYCHGGDNISDFHVLEQAGQFRRSRIWK